MRKSFAWIIIGWLLAWAAPSLALDEIRFNRLGVRDGLSSNEISCVLRDRNGFMWFGTTSGLNRFDGYEFRHCYPRPADSTVVSEGIWDLIETADGMLWLTYYDARIGAYDPLADRFVPEREVLDSLRLDYLPARVFTDRDKRLYYATYDRRFFRYDPLRGMVVPYDLPEGEGGVCGMADSGDRLYVIHHSGKIQGIDKASGKVTFEDGYLTAYAACAPFYLFADSDGELWVFLNPGRSDGLFRLDPRSGRWSHYATDTRPALSVSIVRDVEEGADGSIWIATDHGGINVLDKRTGRIRYLWNDPFDENSLSQNSVICLYRDDTGILWAGTYKNGISYYHESIFKFQSVRYPLERGSNGQLNDFECVVEDEGGDLWIGTGGSGLLRYARSSGRFDRYEAGPEGSNTISGDVVISLERDRRGGLWIGTYLNGLTYFDGKRFHRYRHADGDSAGLSNNSVYSLYADPDNRLWIGTLGGGLDCLDLATGEWGSFRSSDRENSLTTDYVYSVAEGMDGTILAGTSDGVSVIHPQHGEVKRFRGTRDGKNGFEGRMVNVVFSDSRQLAWIGGDYGLSVYDPVGDRLYRLDRESGFPVQGIMSIIEDDYHTVWIGTRDGLLSIVPTRERDGGYHFAWSLYDESEGIRNYTFNANSAARLSTGELVFGGTHGLTWVDPSRIRYNSYAPPAMITSLGINGTPIRPREVFGGRVPLARDISVTDRLTLSHDERNLVFTLASRSYFQPRKNRFAYKMEGFDADWTVIDASDRRVTYTNLPPGDYTLLVKASNNDGVWSKETTRLAITIRPPFWLTGWAISLYILIGLSLAYALMRSVLRAQRKKLQEERMRELRRKQHEVDEMKLRFFTNVSHEFRTPLTLILTPLEKLMKAEADPGTKQLLGLMHRNADRLLRLVNQLLDFRKIDVQGDSLSPSSGDIVPFVRDVVESFRELSERKGIRLTLDSALDTYTMSFDTDKLFKILSNLLSNAFKFTAAGGSISVTLHARESAEGRAELVIEVADTGIGIPADKQEAIFERFYQVNASDERGGTYGTGIGLHLCREFVRMHRGSISVRSELGKGSVFTVVLPVIPPEEPARRPDPEPLPGQEEARPSPDEAGETAGKEPSPEAIPTLLVVDDNTDFREFMSLSLSGMYTVLTAADGEEAWQIIPEKLPDMVISDVMMPITDGITLCRRIKKDIRTSHIPVILLTAKTAADSQLVGLEAGADDYICKPFSMEMLLLKIRHLVETRRRWQQAFLQASSSGIALSEVQVSPLDERLMRKAIAYIEEEIANPELSVERLSREMGMSRVNFYKKCLSCTGKTPVELIRAVRLKRAAQLLEKSQLRVNEVALECGFNDARLFRKYFKEEFGCLPSDYHSKHSPDS